jgi:hypothetical protein
MKEDGKTYALNQNSELMNAIKEGERIWAFTRRLDKTYVLVLDLVVIGKKENIKSDPGYVYGRYHIYGDEIKSRYFDADKGLNAEPIIRSLSFSPRARILGHSFQGLNAVKLLDDIDELTLNKFAARLETI